MRDNRLHVPPPARAGQALDDADLRGALHGRALERAVPPQPGEGADRALGRVRSADPDRLRRRPRARPRRGGQGRRADRPQGRHAGAARGDPARPHEHVDDDQRDGGVAARPLHRHRGGDRRRRLGPPGHDAERHHQGVPLARDLRLPARALHAADRRHRRLHGRARPALEPGQHLLLPPAGGGATPVQEIAYAMATAIAVLDEVRPRVGEERMGAVFARISFFVNAGVRFVEEHAKLRAMAVLWEELGRERYGVTDPKHLRFRYGVQVNSLGLTESQPENNVQRIVLEALAVTLGRDARARAIQLPAWNEALGLPRPWDQQWSLRIQQVLAYETDLLEYPDLFEGSVVMEGLVGELLAGAREELARVAEQGGAVEAVPYMKAALVESHRARIGRIESGEQVLVGVNRFTETEPSPLTEDGGILVVDPEVEAEQRAALDGWRAGRDEAAVRAALAELARVAATEDENVMPATIAAARAGATTGEWAQTLRDAFGSYRAPTGVGEAAAAPIRRGARGAARRGGAAGRAARPRREDPRRQAGARRPLQRRRADRRPRARRRHGGRVRGHPPDARPDRPLGGRRGRARDRPLDPLRLAPRADPGRARRAARGPAAATSRWSSEGSSPTPTCRPCARPASPRSTRRRTSSSRASCATSSGSWPSATVPPSAPDPAALGARLRDRDVTAAPAALNLLENRAPGQRAAIAALLAEVAPVRLGGEAPGHVVGVTGPPGCGEVDAAQRARADLARARADRRRARRRPDLEALGRRAARRPRADRRRPGRPRALHPLDGGRRAARRPRARHARRRPRARGGLRRRRRRDGRRRPVRDRGGRDGGYRRGRRPAGRRRRPPVPEGRDHGGARRARRDQGRPRRDRRRAVRDLRDGAAVAGRRGARARGLVRAAGRRDRGARRRARRRTAPRSTSPPPARARAASARSPTSRPSTARRACARSAAAGPPSASWRSRTRASTPPRWRRRSRARAATS